jgi:hypothetical protein
LTEEFKQSTLKIYNQFEERLKKETDDLSIDPEIEERKKHLAKK